MKKLRIAIGLLILVLGIPVLLAFATSPLDFILIIMVGCIDVAMIMENV